jgi:hypothetical protein
MIIALLSSNQVTYRFGKGLTPKQYRLDLGSLAYIMDGYAGYVPSLLFPPPFSHPSFFSSTFLVVEILILIVPSHCFFVG